MQADELTAARLEAQTHRDAAQAAQRDSAAQLSSIEARAAKAAATAEAAEHTAELLRVEAHNEQQRAVLAEQQCSEKADALAACETQFSELQQQLTTLMEEHEGLRAAQGRVNELEGVCFLCIINIEHCDISQFSSSGKTSMHILVCSTICLASVFE